VRTILYGQAPSRRSGGKIAFVGAPNGTLLAELAGVPADTFHELVDCRNLLTEYPGRSGPKGDDFPMAKARSAAAIERGTWGAHDVVLFAGRSVASAFRFGTLDWFEWTRAQDGQLVVLIPHPSRVNHMWNDPAVHAAAARVLRDAIAGSRVRALEVQVERIEQELVRRGRSE